MDQALGLGNWGGEQKCSLGIEARQKSRIPDLGLARRQQLVKEQGGAQAAGGSALSAA